MATKNIFFGILIIVVFVIAGLWIWNSQMGKVECLNLESAKKVEKCVGKEINAVGVFNSVLAGEKGIGALNFNDGTSLQLLESRPDLKNYDKRKIEIKGELYKCGIMDQCAGIGIKNIKSLILVSGNVPTQEEVILTTDKAEYTQGENVKVNVNNLMIKDIQYRPDFSPCCGSAFLQKKNNENKWERIYVSIPEPRPAPRPEERTKEGWLLLEPKKQAQFEWNLVTLNEKTEKVPAPIGTYRIGFNWFYPYSQDGGISYSNEFIIKEQKFSQNVINLCKKERDNFRNCQITSGCVDGFNEDCYFDSTKYKKDELKTGFSFPEETKNACFAIHSSNAC